MKAGHGCGRRLALIAFVATLTACGHDKPPTTVADACRMQSERPQWFAAMRKTEAKYDARPDEVAGLVVVSTLLSVPAISLLLAFFV